MKVVVAMDSFKGSLTSMEAGQSVKRGILAAEQSAEVVVSPLADGGEGTLDALMEGMNAKRVTLTVTGPLGEPVLCCYGYLEESDTAVMEMASAAGITLVKQKEPLRATTYGVGEMITDALDRGCKKILIGLGGSATNDGGVGMLRALGFAFLDENGADVGDGAAALARIRTIRTENADARLSKVIFQVACDVKNPLCGENGATYVYGAQKGIAENQKTYLDEAMRHYADVTAEFLHVDLSESPGAGAAGGMGYAFLAYLHGILTPGIDRIMEITGLEDVIRTADIVVTGEGRLDGQTVMGKVPVGVAELAKKYGKHVIAFAGSVTSEAVKCNQKGIDAFFPVIRSVTTLEEAMRPEVAKENIAAAAEQVFRLMRLK